MGTPSPPPSNRLTAAETGAELTCVTVAPTVSNPVGFPAASLTVPAVALGAAGPGGVGAAPISSGALILPATVVERGRTTLSLARVGFSGVQLTRMDGRGVAPAAAGLIWMLEI